MRRALPLLLVPAVVASALAAACGPRNVTTIHVPRSTETVLNPERGLFVDIDLVYGRDFRDVRADGYTLGFAYVRLDAWRTVALPPDLIDNLSQGLDAARDAGIKVILRFAYNRDEFGADAPKWAVLAHIQQLTPLLRANADVIAVLDAGFIGVWGEWHSSTYGLDNQTDRGDILWALLHALPPTRSTLVRSPLYKVAAYGDAVHEHALTGSDASRVGHVNSCFLASETDLGTYVEPIDRWKDYLARDGLATPVGGETCAVAPPRTDCPTATDELRRLHWSFLNAQYHPDVVAGWRAQGCLGEIRDHLGYRLELESITYGKDARPGGAVDVEIRLRNTGYAAPFNPRPVYVAIDDGEPLLLADDPRLWHPGAVTIRARLELSAGLAPGAHRLSLLLPDADARLRTPERTPLFSIRIAGARWDDTTGANILTDALLVSRGSP
ncbi:MAG TPA: DUF4832 domain-containing protein [Kofleriaceae bacterium]|nr:DUF4832 domain-containing protein [Kofleriaceae bacterium]